MQQNLPDIVTVQLRRNRFQSSLDSSLKLLFIASVLQTVCIQTKAVTSDETALPGGKMASAASDLKLPAVLKSKYDVGDELARYVS